MATQVRDTTFGHIVRLLSSNKIFQYPDEVDPSLWKKCLQGDTGSAPTPPREQTSEPQGVKLEDLNQGQAVEDGKDIYLVDWYGPDDPEVCSPVVAAFWKLLLTQHLEPPELV